MKFNFFVSSSSNDAVDAPEPAPSASADDTSLRSSAYSVSGKEVCHEVEFERTKAVLKIPCPLPVLSTNTSSSPSSSSTNLAALELKRKSSMNDEILDERGADCDQLNSYSVDIDGDMRVKLLDNKAHINQSKRQRNLDLSGTSIVSGTYEGGGEVELGCDRPVDELVIISVDY